MIGWERRVLLRHVRIHGTTRGRPAEREPEKIRRLASVPRVTIERRPLAEYDRLAAGIS